MTSGEFVHLLVEKVTYWYLCLISEISGLCQNSFPFQNSLDVPNSVHTLHDRGFQEMYKEDVYVDIYIYQNLMKYIITSFPLIIFQRFNLFKSCLVVSSI